MPFPVDQAIAMRYTNENCVISEYAIQKQIVIMWRIMCS